MKKIYLFVSGLLLLAATAGAQSMLKDLAPGVNISSNPQNFITINGSMYFITRGGSTYVHRIWKSDGSAANTVILKDSVITTSVGGVIELIDVNGSLFFALYKNGSSSSATTTELWKSDGTSAGTTLITTLTNPPPLSGGSAPAKFTAMGNKLFFIMGKTNGRELWSCDGTAAGTMEVADIAPGSTGGLDNKPIFAHNGKIYFSGASNGYNFELFASDGTAGGTSMVKEICAGVNNGSNPGHWIVYNNELYFKANNGTDDGLWKTDGTSAGTVLISLGGFNSPVIFKNAICFTRGPGLWKTDGTTSGTQLLKDSAGYACGGNNDYLFAIYTKSLSVPPYFKTYYWKTDGTAAGTVPVSKNLGSSAGFTVINNAIYYAKPDSGSATQVSLWENTGTEASLKKIFTGTGISYLYVYNNKLYFTNFDQATGYELWVYDPATSSSVLANEELTDISSIYPNPSSGSLNIQTTNNYKNTRLKISSLRGEVLLSETLKAGYSSLNLDKLPNGIYFLQLIQDEKVQTEKFIIQK
jgi:ELWxxDGT repeat protein